MEKKGLLSAFVLCFYMAIIMYVFFAVLHINTLENYVAAMAFEMIGFALLACFIFIKPIKPGFLIPIVCTTVVYTIILDVVNIAFVATLPHVYFVLTNIILLFIYCIIILPMYVMGRR